MPQNKPVVLEKSNKNYDWYTKNLIQKSVITEIGIPTGYSGRTSLLELLPKALPTLWAHSHPELQLLPPVFFAHGSIPEETFFTSSNQPVKDIRQALLKNYFKRVIVDVERQKITKKEWAFMKLRAKENKQSIIIIRDYFLSNKSGNIWAKSRFNLSRKDGTLDVVLTPVRGLYDSPLYCH